MNASAPARAAAPRAAAIESGAALDSDALRDAASCPVREALAPLSGAWASGIVARLARGSARFGQLRAALVRPDGTTVSAKVLTADLRRLAEAGVVERVARGRASVSYRLTDKGRALVPLLDALAEWATDDALDERGGTVRGGRRVLDRRLSRTPLL